MNFQGKPVLVTGAGGFIGSHLTAELVKAGARVRAFVRYTSRGGAGQLDMLPPEITAEVEVIPGDLRDAHAVRAAVAGSEIVFHLGALIAIPYSYLHPSEVVDVNINGTLNVLNAARSAEVGRVIHTSTSEVYGTARTVPIAETHPLTPQSPYSASKIGADAIAESYYRAFGLPVAIMRPFNTFGPRQSGRAAIPTIVGQALWKEQVRLGLLSPTRDFTYVEDTAHAFMALAGCDAALGQTLNAGNGKEISIGDLAQRIIELVGRPVSVVSEEQRKRPEKSEVQRLVCDADRFRQLTGWAPRVTLDQGLKRVIEFMRGHPRWTDINRYEV